MRFQSDKVAAFRALFESKKSMIRNFPGCHHLELLQEVDKQETLCTYSIWDGTEALENYRQSDLFQETWKDTKALFADKPKAISLHKLDMLP